MRRRIVGDVLKVEVFKLWAPYYLWIHANVLIPNKRQIAAHLGDTLEAHAVCALCVFVQ